MSGPHRATFGRSCIPPPFSSLTCTLVRKWYMILEACWNASTRPDPHVSKLPQRTQERFGFAPSTSIQNKKFLHVYETPHLYSYVCLPTRAFNTWFLEEFTSLSASNSQNEHLKVLEDPKFLFLCPQELQVTLVPCSSKSNIVSPQAWPNMKN